jgi:hypothetical protein
MKADVGIFFCLNPKLHNPGRNRCISFENRFIW